MRNMKKLLNRETHTLLCGDNQFQAALSMVARSRSPLPPSPTSATTSLLDSDTCPFMSLKLPSVSHYQNSTNNLFLVNSVQELSPPPLKPKMNQTDPPSIKLPEKPPRKVTPVAEMIEKDTPEVHESHSLATYDDVEVRNEAWRTMGVDVTNHKDLFKAIPMQAIPHRTVSPKLDKSDSQKIFHISNNGLGNYDRLQHLGPTCKQSTAPGYKQIPIISNSVSNLRLDEPIFACRRADDFKGYGMIRKKSTVCASNEDVSKQFLSEDIKYEYAIVYKPERV